MRIKIFVYILFIVIILGVLTYKKETVQIYKSELSYNFGIKNHKDSTSIMHTFRMVNSQTTPLQIIGVKLSDSCIKLNSFKIPKEIQKNETLKIAIKYNNQFCNEKGYISKIISVKFKNKINKKDSTHHFYLIGKIE